MYTKSEEKKRILPYVIKLAENWIIISVFQIKL